MWRTASSTDCRLLEWFNTTPFLLSPLAWLRILKSLYRTFQTSFLVCHVCIGMRNDYFKPNFLVLRRLHSWMSMCTEILTINKLLDACWPTGIIKNFGHQLAVSQWMVNQLSVDCWPKGFFLYTLLVSMLASRSCIKGRKYNFDSFISTMKLKQKMK